MSNIIRRQEAHLDIHGSIGTALGGVTQWTPTQYRTTGIVLNEIASGDIFSFNCQMNHDKKLTSPLDGLHIHCIPKASQNGFIAFNYEWGFYNIGDTIPATLPNTGTTADIAIATTDQYVHRLFRLISNMATSAIETYSGQLLVKFTAVAPAAGTNWWSAGGTNRIALLDVDTHYITDRYGSVNEGTD